MVISSFSNEMINLRPILLRTLIVKVDAKNIFKMKHFSSFLSLQRQWVSKGIPKVSREVKIDINLL